MDDHIAFVDLSSGIIGVAILDIRLVLGLVVTHDVNYTSVFTNRFYRTNMPYPYLRQPVSGLWGRLPRSRLEWSTPACVGTLQNNALLKPATSLATERHDADDRDRYSNLSIEQTPVLIVFISILL